jgi:hypothetical protein
MSAGMARLTDLGLAVVVLLFAAHGAFRGWSDAVLNIAMIVPLVWRRRWPALVFGVVAVFAFAQWLIGGQPQPSSLASPYTAPDLFFSALCEWSCSGPASELSCVAPGRGDGGGYSVRLRRD